MISRWKDPGKQTAIDVFGSKRTRRTCRKRKKNSVDETRPSITSAWWSRNDWEKKSKPMSMMPNQRPRQRRARTRCLLFSEIGWTLWRVAHIHARLWVVALVCNVGHRPSTQKPFAGLLVDRDGRVGNFVGFWWWRWIRARKQRRTKTDEEVEKDKSQKTGEEEGFRWRGAWFFGPSLFFEA